MNSRVLKGLVLLIPTSIVATLVSCTKDDSGPKVGVSTQLISITSNTAFTQATSNVNSASGTVGTLDSSNNEADVAIDSFKIVLSDIGISTGTDLTGVGGDVIYSCSGSTDEDCYVDLAQAGAVDGLLETATYNIRPGDYRFAMIGTCKSNIADQSSQGSYIKIKGRILSGGNWYYTTAATGDSQFFLTQLAGSTWSPPSNYDEARIWVSGCRTYNVFQKSIPLSEGQTVAIKMFYDLRRSVVFKNNGMTSDGCTSPKGQSHVSSSATEFQICGGYPYLAGMITADKPDLHRYIVSTSSSNAQVFGVYFEKGTTTAVGAYNYEYVGTGGYVNPENFSQVIKKVKNTEGTTDKLTLVTYGGQTSTDVIDELPGDFNTTELPILNSVSASQAFTATDGNGATINATATRIE